MKKCFTFLAIILAVIGFAAPISARPLKPIFDGKTFNGWEERGDAIWQVENGTIVGKTGGGGFGWLCTKKIYGDFILELELRIEDGNSGVQIRSHFEEKDKMVGYQIEIDSSKRAWSGGLYEQGRRGWLNNLADNEPARAAFKVGEWNKYRIRCVGDSIKSWVNGVAAADYVDSMDIEGIIALQVHSGKNCKVEFRNLRLVDLGRRQWKPLWDGKTFSGWHIIGEGDWKIENGVIGGRHSKAVAAFSHLVTDKVFTDFTVRLKYKSITGNSGFYFRIKEEGVSGVTGFQAEIDAAKDAGGLYETGGRAWVSQPKPEDVMKYFKPQQWNTMTVSAHGQRVAVDVNGTRSAELRDDPGAKKGNLALQLHGGQDVEVYFRDIEILGEARRGD